MQQTLCGRARRAIVRWCELIAREAAPLRTLHRAQHKGTPIRRPGSAQLMSGLAVPGR